MFRTLIAAVREVLAQRAEQAQGGAGRSRRSCLRGARAERRGCRQLAARGPGRHDPRPRRSEPFARSGNYEAQLEELNERLLQAEHELYLARIPAVICYEGWDAAGKGGNIRRLTLGLDPRGYEVVPIAAPTQEEKAHHYLWRFWRCIPKAGHITIFDRTWYGRVLVERVEGFCSEAEWQRAYDEINEFERQLTDFGAVMVKFWLQIDADGATPPFPGAAGHALQAVEDHRRGLAESREAAAYEPAVDEMLRRTSTPHAPWTILEANCKYYARIKALRTVAEALEKAVGRSKG